MWLSKKEGANQKFLKMDNLLLDKIFTAEGAEPVTLADVKSWLKIDVPDDDTLLTSLITASRQLCEGFLNMSLIPRTVTAFLFIGLDEIRLPYGPVNEVTEVANSNTGEPVEYTLKYEKFKALDPCTEVRAKYTAGETAANLEQLYKTAILMEVASLYEHRGDETEEGTGLSPAVKKLLKPYRRVT